MKKVFLYCLAAIFATGTYAQTYNWVSSTEANIWQQSKAKLQLSTKQTPLLEISGTEEGTIFKAWGTTFNELCWDALNILTRDEQDNLLEKMFSPQGDLRFTRGRISMNANDYARDWYSCDEVSGDFQLKYFNINRDKLAIMSPESNIALYEDNTEKREDVFPKQLAVNDYMIQDPRYLQTYANYFCKFIDAYKEQGIPIDMVMYQNEAYSYTPYPGCAWTAEGTVRFNVEYLAPTLKKYHPEVKLYLGTFNTNRYDYVDKILSDPRMPQSIEGIGFQWEGGQILPKIRKKYPQYKYVQSESECGGGTFDWRAGEHTFHLINHYLGNGCEEYTFWNNTLCDNGESPWGWKQNALIHVDSKSRTATLTPEYYAVRHYSQFVTPGSRVIAYKPSTEGRTPVLVVETPEKKKVVIAGNFNNETKKITLKLGNRYLNVELQPHSFNTFEEK